jgi:hypothetical protein
VSRDRSVGIATAYEVYCRGSIPGRSMRFFSSPPLLDQASNTMGTGLSPAVKRPGREAEHSPPFSDEVRNGGAIPPLPHTSSWRCATLIFVFTYATVGVY